MLCGEGVQWWGKGWWFYSFATLPIGASIAGLVREFSTLFPALPSLSITGTRARKAPGTVPSGVQAARCPPVPPQPPCLWSPQVLVGVRVAHCAPFFLEVAALGAMSFIDAMVALLEPRTPADSRVLRPVGQMIEPFLGAGVQGWNRAGYCRALHCAHSHAPCNYTIEWHSRYLQAGACLRKDRILQHTA